jgi:hypothetical protein
MGKSLLKEITCLQQAGFAFPGLCQGHSFGVKTNIYSQHYNPVWFITYYPIHGLYIHMEIATASLLRNDDYTFNRTNIGRWSEIAQRHQALN